MEKMPCGNYSAEKQFKNDAKGKWDETMELKWKRKGHKPIMGDVEIEGVHLLTFPQLTAMDMIAHGFSTRLGGVSQGQYSTMNFTFTRGDDPKHVMENYRRMAKVLGVDEKKMVLSYQTHTTKVRVVTEEDAGKGVVRERDYRDVDGLVTNVPGITLVTFFADCVPLYFVDPVHRAIGLSHSGWRGTVNRMGRVTLETMAKQYGTRPEDVLCCIGPSICQDCFEVGGEVIEIFKKEFGEIYWQGLFYQREEQIQEGKYQLDLWKANEIILREAGVMPEHIQITDICTKCNPEYLFSHRVMGDQRGNLAAFLSLRAGLCRAHNSGTIRPKSVDSNIIL